MSQNVSPIADRSWFQGASLAAAAPRGMALTLLALSAYGLQRRLGADTDVHWLIDLAGRWLDGQKPYVDFVEINPPASILLYLGPTALARAFGLGPDSVAQACVFLVAAAELAVAAAVARRAALVDDFGTAGLFWIVAALLLLPGFTFAQRDHLALILGLPLFAILPARALSRPVDAPWAIVGGLGAGCMVFLRPHYALALAPPALLALHRSGWRVAAQAPEFIACALILVLYALAVFLAFPHFVSDILPMDVAVYAHGGAPVGWLLTRDWLIVWISLATALWGTRRALLASAPAGLLVLASAGALASYLLQDKGWPYHLYVADALILAGFAIANRETLRQTGLVALAVALALAAVSAALVLAFLAQGVAPFAILRYSLFFPLVLLSGWLALKPPGASGPAKPPPWTILGVASLGLLAGEMAMLEGAHPPYFAAEMAAIGPRPSIALVAGDGAAGIDLASQTGGIYAPRTFAMNILELAANRLGRGGTSPKAEATLRRYIREDRDRLAATVRAGRPDAIVVDPDWARRYVGTAFLTDLLAGYRLRATTKWPEHFLETPTLQLFTREPAP